MSFQIVEPTVCLGCCGPAISYGITWPPAFTASWTRSLGTYPSVPSGALMLTASLPPACRASCIRSYGISPSVPSGAYSGMVALADSGTGVHFAAVSSTGVQPVCPRAYLPTPDRHARSWGSRSLYSLDTKCRHHRHALNFSLVRRGRDGSALAGSFAPLPVWDLLKIPQVHRLARRPWMATAGPVRAPEKVASGAFVPSFQSNPRPRSPRNAHGVGPDSLTGRWRSCT
jgi:hypothetical protein